MANLKPSMVKDEAVKPYKLKNGTNIYSVEEAIYLFYQDFKEYGNDFFDDKFIEWVYEICDVDIARRLDDINSQNNFYQKSIDFLTFNDFYTSEEVELISLNIFNWEKRAYLEKGKIKGDKYFKEKAYNKAIESYKNTLDFDINNHLLYNNIGVCYTRLKLYDDALHYLKRAYQINDNKDILYNIIEVFIEKMDYVSAKSYIENIHHIDKKQYYIGILYIKQKNYDTAINILNDSYSNSKDELILIEIAKCYIAQGMYDKAYDCLKNIGDTNTSTLVEKSIIFKQLGNIPMSIKCIEQANFNDRDNYELWLKLSQYFREDYNLSRAESSISKAHALAPENEHILFEKAIIKKSQGKFAEYKNLLAKLLKNICENYRKKDD